MWSSMLMHHGSSEGSSKIAIKRLGRNPPGRPRKIAPLVTSPVYEGRYSPKSFAHPRASVPPKKLTQSPIKPKRKSSIPQKRDWDGMSTELLEDPVVMGEGTEEPAVCKRCHLNVAGIDHFDRQHNGLLMEEQNSFTVQEKRAVSSVSRNTRRVVFQFSYSLRQEISVYVLYQGSFSAAVRCSVTT